jgi:hypothetical protein
MLPHVPDIPGLFNPIFTGDPSALPPMIHDTTRFPLYDITQHLVLKCSHQDEESAHGTRRKAHGFISHPLSLFFSQLLIFLSSAFPLSKVPHPGREPNKMFSFLPILL